MLELGLEAVDDVDTDFSGRAVILTVRTATRPS